MVFDGVRENRQRQGQPQVLRLRGSQNAVSHFAQDDNFGEGGRKQATGNSNGNGNSNGKSNDNSNGNSNSNSNSKSKSKSKSKGGGASLFGCAQVRMTA